VRVHRARGEVFVKGKPAQGAVVHLHPRDKEKCRPAFATVQADGTFHLTTYSESDGAAIGDYVVTVSWTDEKRVDGETIYSSDKLKNRYSQIEKSSLKATIQPGENTLPRFDLK
jgi:hypothetical protein